MPGQVRTEVSSHPLVAPVGCGGEWGWGPNLHSISSEAKLFGDNSSQSKMASFIGLLCQHLQDHFSFSPLEAFSCLGLEDPTSLGFSCAPRHQLSLLRGPHPFPGATFCHKSSLLFSGSHCPVLSQFHTFLPSSPRTLIMMWNHRTYVVIGFSLLSSPNTKFHKDRTYLCSLKSHVHRLAWPLYESVQPVFVETNMKANIQISVSGSYHITFVNSAHVSDLLLGVRQPRAPRRLPAQEKTLFGSKLALSRVL